VAQDKAQPEGPTEDNGGRAQSEKTENNEARTQSEGQTISFGEASAFLGVLAVAVYCVGIVTLWVPLARTYTSGDYSTAWYAVSLIPRTTVIGKGILLIAFPLLVSMMAILVTLPVITVSGAIRNRNLATAAP
jgi:hypothetical protein